MMLQWFHSHFGSSNTKPQVFWLARAQLGLPHHDMDHGTEEDHDMGVGAAIDPELEAKADQKREFVQAFIRRLEKAMCNYAEKDRQWIQRILDPADPCFRTLVKILVQRKYQGFTSLQCVILRAVQMMLKIAVQVVAGKSEDDTNLGMQCLQELSGQQLALQAFSYICKIANNDEEPILACNALLVLSVLGRDAFDPRLVENVLKLFIRLPDRADELADVALRLHLWNGKCRGRLLELAITHPGGKLLCEVLIQMVNRGDEMRRITAMKVLTDCLRTPGTDSLLYTNDVRVLVEILLRELPNHASNSGLFLCHAECFKALAERFPAARVHRQQEVVQVLEDLRDDETNSMDVQSMCSEVLAALLTQPTGTQQN